MAETNIPELHENTTMQTARGRDLTPAQKNQLALARQSKARLAEENRIRQQETIERLAGLENMLKTVASKAPESRKRQREEPEGDSSDEEVPSFPDPAPRKRPRLTNPHRARREDEEHGYEEHAPQGGWSWPAKVFTLGGLIAFNSVVAVVMRKVRQSSTTTTPPNDPPTSDVLYV